MTNDRTAEPTEARLPVWAVALVHILFFFSGAAALVYEVVWMRMLSLVFGNTTYAVSVVLAVFLGGLAIGAWRFGKQADRRGDLLRVYGLLEAGAAIIALLLPSLLLGVLDPLYGFIYRWAGESVLALTIARVVLSGVLLLGPAILLGGTLPVLIRFMVRRAAGMEAHIGRLYGLNTLGGVAGAFAAGFLLMPFLGLRLSNIAGAALGLAVALAALSLHKRLGSAPSQSVSQEAAPAPPGLRQVGGKWLLLAFALSGFAALAYEVLWTRLLIFFVESIVYAFSAMLSVYLLGLALGSLLYAALLSRARRQVRWFIILEVLIGLSAAATIPLFLILRQLQTAGMKGSFWGTVEWFFIAAAVIMILPTILIGAVFPLVCGLWARATGRVGASVGQVYLVNTLGTVAGSLLAGFVLVPAIGTRLALLAVAGLNIFAGFLVWAVTSRARWQLPVKAAAAVALPALLFAGMSHRYPADVLAPVYEHGEPLEIEWVREGIDGTVTVERAREQKDDLYGQGADRRLSINGVNVAGTRVDSQTTQKLQAHLGLLVRPRSERVLQVGFGSGGTAYSASLHEVDRIDCIEISKAVIEAAPRFEETNHGVLRDSRIHLYLEDARSFVRHTPHRYDVILSDSSHPILAGEGLLYSVDYLRDCAARLKPGGVFSTWLPVYGMRLEDVKVMVRSIREVFPYVYIWHTSVGRNEWCIVHAMAQPLAIQYDAFAAEMGLPRVEEDLAGIGLSRPEEVLALLLYDHEAVDGWLSDVGRLNTDDNGYLEFFGPRGAHQPGGRKVNFLFTFPDIVLNAGGSILDYVAGPGGPDAPWRARLRRELAANQHILHARLYEFANQDRYDLLALMEYRRAIAAAPDHFVARTMLGLTSQQMEWTLAATTREGDSLFALDQLAAASLELGRLPEAADWAEMMARHSPAEPGPSAVLAVLREDPDELAAVLARRRAEGLEMLMGMPAATFEQAVEWQRAAAAQPWRPELAIRLGHLYEAMAAQIWINTPTLAASSATLRMRTFRTAAVAALVDLAGARYEQALGLAPADDLARFRLASVRATRGEYLEAIALLDAIAQDALQTPLDDASMASVWQLTASLRELERRPFAFLEDIQQAVRREVERHSTQPRP